MNVRLYIRVSHDEQVKFGYSIDAQLEALKNYCMENNHHIIDTYIDEGISAGSINKRHEFQRMINEAKNGEVILFTKIDRFSRNLLDANIVVKRLTEKGVSIKAISEDDIDTLTADGKFIFNLKLSLAERERNKCGERINDVFKYKAQNGEVISGKVPFGYKIENKKYVRDDPKADALLDIFEYYSLHQNLSMSLRYFNDKYPQYKLEYNNLKLRLKNEIYIGKHKYNDNFCPPIIPKELFDKVQDKLNSNIRTPKSKNIFLFSQLVECDTCKRMMAGNKTIRKFNNPNWKKSDYYIYRCNHAYQNRMCTNRHTLLEKKVEEYLLDNFNALLYQRIVDIELENKKVDNSRRIAQIKKKLSKLKDLYLDDLIDKNEYQEDYRRLNDELNTLSKDKIQDTSRLKELLEINIKETYEKLDREQKRALWHTVINKIVFHEDMSFEISLI